MFRKILFVAAFFLPATVVAQKVQASDSNTWDLAAGFHVEREPGGGSYAYGWSGCISQRPYEKHPWIGGTIEGTGVYQSNAGSTFGGHSSLFTAMAGPLFRVNAHGVHPFAHIMLGGVVATETLILPGNYQFSYTNDYFGNMLGGGIDFPVSRHVSIRTQADWLRIWQDATTGTNTLRLNGGIVYSF